MCGAFAHVSPTPSLLSRRSALWLCFDNAEIFSSSCHSFVTRSPLSWSHDMEIHGTYSGSQLRRAHLPGIAGQTRPSSWQGRGGGQKGVKSFRKLEE